VTSYDEANGRTTVALVSRLTIVSANVGAGRPISVTRSTVGADSLGQAPYAYDKADIDPAGAVTDYIYNANGQLCQTLAYTTRISPAGLATRPGNRPRRGMHRISRPRWPPCGRPRQTNIGKSDASTTAPNASLARWMRWAV